MAIPKLKLKKGEALCLRTSNLDGSSRNGFVWPKKGMAICPDWLPTASCGNGLHGLLHGVGDGSLLEWGEAAWIVVKVLLADVVKIDDAKVKFPKGDVVYFGEQFEAVALITEHAPAGSVIVSGTATAGVSGTATAGYSGTATAGYRGTATAGDRGAATAGDRGTATAGDRGTATAGDRGTATAGYSGTATAGYRGTATAGVSGTATAGYRGTATAGDRGTATAGDRGTATAGYSGTATAGYRGTATAGVSGTATAGYRGTATAGVSGTATAGVSGTATAGEDGCISILYWNGQKYKRAVFLVGENGIEPNEPYRVDETGKPFKAV